MNYPADVCLDHPVMDGMRRRISGRKSRAGETSGLSDGRNEKNSMQNYETYYKKLDLYYQFSYRFDKIIDEEWLVREREKTEAVIMRFLSRGKKGYIARCQYCGRLLPVGYMAGKCKRCFERRG